MLSASQIRAARAAIGWSSADLAEASGLARGTIQNLESDANEHGRKSSKLAIKAVLEAAGIEFIEADDGAPGIIFRIPKSNS